MSEGLRSRTAAKVYITLAGLFIAGFLLDHFILPWIIHSGDEIPVPNVIGKPMAEAVRILEAQQLVARKSVVQPSYKYPQGTVIMTNPPPGNIVREGRNIYLTISGGGPQVTMPNLRGHSLRDARITLEHYDLRIGKITYDPSSQPEETIISQSIPPGKNVAKGSVVDLSVSGGEGSLQVSVPYVIGLSLEEAQTRLMENGLRLGKITYKSSMDLLPNTVIAQMPRAGDMVDVGTPIDVTLVH